MKVFITGIAGFIGGHLARELMQDGIEVTGCDKLIRGGPALVPKGATWDQTDVRSYSAVHADVVVNLAAIADVNWPNPADVWRENVQAACHAATLAERANARLIQASTAAVNEPAANVYAITKWAAEQIVFAHGGLALRLANVHGPGGHGVLDLWRRAAQNREPLIVHGTGTQTRDFIHVSDVCRAVLAAILTPDAQGALDICSGVQTPVYDAAVMIGGEVILDCAKDAGVEAIVQDPGPARDVLGFAVEQQIAA